MAFRTEFLDWWWSWEPLQRSCVRCGWCTAPYTPYTRPKQRLSRQPPIKKLGAEFHILQLNILCSWWWAYVPETYRTKNTSIKSPSCIKLAFHFISWGRCTFKQPSSLLYCFSIFIIRDQISYLCKILMRTLIIIHVSLVVFHNLRRSYASLHISFSYIILCQSEKLNFIIAKTNVSLRRALSFLSSEYSSNHEINNTAKSEVVYYKCDRFIHFPRCSFSSNVLRLAFSVSYFVTQEIYSKRL